MVRKWKNKIREIEIIEEKIDWKFVLKTVGFSIVLLCISVLDILVFEAKDIPSSIAKLGSSLFLWYFAVEKYVKFIHENKKKKVVKKIKVIGD